MLKITLEDWLHASDEERINYHENWAVENDDGLDIVTAVANMFKEECVYDVSDVVVHHRLGKWVIGAFVSTDDYQNLKDRSNIKFLGFNIAFECNKS
jgi:hypothetical protein